MKKIMCVLSIFTILTSCNNSNTGNEKHDGSDSTGLTNPVSIDTIKHPSGVDNSSAISTDTAAMNVQNSIKKADSVKKEKGK